LSDFRIPPNRAPVRALNAGWGALQRFGIARPGLTRESLVRSARKRSGLSGSSELGADFDDPVTQDALWRLLDALEGEAQLHAFGRVVIRGTLVNSLVTRMRLEQLSKQYPEIPAMPVEEPVFIAGLARTGTTLLHRLLGCEPRLRPLLAWEGLTPAPLAGAPAALSGKTPAALFGRETKPGQPDPRVKLARIAERALRYLAPDFFAIHPVEADGYEEDVLLQDGSFMSPTVDATMPVPTYSAWLHSTDQRPMYRYFRRLVQLLLWQRPGTYLGKTPHHLENLPILLEVFPGAKVIVTHRDPAQVVPSFCSMMAHGRRLFSNDVNLENIGRQFHAKQLKGVTDAMNARRELPAKSFIDVHYADLMADPMKQIRRIYDFLGYELLPETTRAMNAFRGQNPKDKRGVHHYGPEDFGLTREQLDRDFAAYRDHYGIAQESR
jgi:hypothetical protein